jgi:hypothetical protein
MTQSAPLIWPWLEQTFGTNGAIAVLILAVLFGLSWIITPVFVWRIYRKSAVIETMLEELGAAQSRQNQVERIQQDRERKRPPRRRRRR